MPPSRDPALLKVESASQEGPTQLWDTCGHTSMSSEPTGQQLTVSGPQLHVGHGEWVNMCLYSPLDAERQYNAVMAL